jgi:hypothetical protein
LNNLLFQRLSAIRALAENTQSKNRDSTATGTLANTGTIGLEAIDACRSNSRVGTVNINNITNTSTTALSLAIESSRAGIKIAAAAAAATTITRRSSEDAGEEDSENWEELHFREVDLLFWDGKI